MREAQEVFYPWNGLSSERERVSLRIFNPLIKAVRLDDALVLSDYKILRQEWFHNTLIQ